MNNVGIIWQYGDYADVQQQQVDSNQPIEHVQDKTFDIRHENYPLLGRRVELMMVVAQIMLLGEPPDSANRRRDLAAIIFEGARPILS